LSEPESRCPLSVAPPLAFGDERLRGALGNSRGSGELAGAGADEQHVTARLEDSARQRDRVRDTRDRGDRAALEPVAFHDRRVHLDGAVVGEDRAAARVEAGMILEHADGALDRVEGGAALGENLPAGQRRGSHTLPKLVRRVRQIGAGAAVDDDRWNARCGNTVGG